MQTGLSIIIVVRLFILKLCLENRTKMVYWYSHLYHIKLSVQYTQLLIIYLINPKRFTRQVPMKFTRGWVRYVVQHIYDINYILHVSLRVNRRIMLCGLFECSPWIIRKLFVLIDGQLDRNRFEYTTIKCICGVIGIRSSLLLA